MLGNLVNVLGNMNCTVDHVEIGRLAVEHGPRDDVDIIYLRTCTCPFYMVYRLRNKYGVNMVANSATYVSMRA